MTSPLPRPAPGAVLHFRPLAATTPAIALPCDGAGRVDLDALSEPARNDYFFARRMVGRAFRAPEVLPGATR